MDDLSLWTPVRVRDLRNRLGFGRADLARRLGLTLSEVVAWEEGKASIPEEMSLPLRSLEKNADSTRENLCWLPRAEQYIESGKLSQLNIEDIES